MTLAFIFKESLLLFALLLTVSTLGWQYWGVKYLLLGNWIGLRLENNIH